MARQPHDRQQQRYFGASQSSCNACCDKLLLAGQTDRAARHWRSSMHMRGRGGGEQGGRFRAAAAAACCLPTKTLTVLDALPVHTVLNPVILCPQVQDVVSLGVTQGLQPLLNSEGRQGRGRGAPATHAISCLPLVAARLPACPSLDHRRRLLRLPRHQLQPCACAAHCCPGCASS